MTYDYSKAVEQEITPARSAAAVTPSDTVDLTNTAKALYVGVEGDVSLDTLDGSTAVVFKGVQGILPVVTTRVRVTSTTATDIVALW